MLRPSTSPCGGPPPNCGLATHEPARNAVTPSNRRWVKASIVMMTYSAIAGSWPNTLQTVTPFGTAAVSRRSSPAATDCSRRRRGAGGNEDRQICPTTISACASNGASCAVSCSSWRIELSSGVVTLARIRGATLAAKWPRNRAFICFPRQLMERTIVTLLSAVAKGLDSGTPYIAVAKRHFGLANGESGPPAGTSPGLGENRLDNGARTTWAYA